MSGDYLDYGSLSVKVHLYAWKLIILGFMFNKSALEPFLLGLLWGYLTSTILQMLDSDISFIYYRGNGLRN
jgi:hypothetical protein